MLNAWGRLDVWVTSSGLLGPPSIEATTPADLQKCFEANSLAPFFALKYAPPAMGKLTSKGHYPNAAEKDVKYGSIIVVSSVASTYGGELADIFLSLIWRSDMRQGPHLTTWNNHGSCRPISVESEIEWCVYAMGIR